MKTRRASRPKADLAGWWPFFRNEDGHFYLLDYSLEYKELIEVLLIGETI